MIKNILKLIRDKKYMDAIIEIESGRGGAVGILNRLNLNYCLHKINLIKIDANHQHESIKAITKKNIYLVGKTKLELDIKDVLIKNLDDFIFEKIDQNEIKHIPHHKIRIFVTDDNPSMLDLYRISGTELYPSDVVFQITSNSNNHESRSKTVDWLRKLGLNCFLFDLLEEKQESDRLHTDSVQLLDIENRVQVPSILATTLGISTDDLYKNALLRATRLDINFFDNEEITKKIRNNIGRDKLITKLNIDSYNEGVLSFPKDSCELFLKNKYYNITGIAKPKTKEVTDYFSIKSVHKNYYSEIIKTELNFFEKNPKEFLSNGQTAIFLDPTCYDQESGISSYLVNMYKFFKMSRLVEQTLFIKNPWPSSDKNNRELFRKFIAEKFNPHLEFNNNIIYFDSEAHYPGLLLSTSFKKICVVHCSSILAAKFDNKLPEKMPKSLVDIMKNELRNINSAHKTITPTIYHDTVQKSFYRKELPEFIEYQSDYLINYIHDEYIEFTPFRDRTFDLVFIGRPQKLKGFDVLLALAKIAKNLTIAIITNERNAETDELKSLKNVTLYFETPKDIIYKILSKSKAFIDLSPHHNCSTVLLEAMNAKTPAVLRDLDTYCEIIKESDLMDLFLLVDEEEILKPVTLASKIIKYLEKLSQNEQDEHIEKLFNKFMLERYVENYRYYSNILSELDFNIKKYNTSPVYENFIKNKRIINVVHSNALTDVDGKIIDSHDIVVRFNRAVENIVPERHGSRTDILYSCLNRSPESGNMTEETYNNWILPIGCWVAKAYPNLQWTGTFSFTQDHQAGATNDNYRFESFNLDPLRTSEFSIEWFKLIEANIKSRPNTGVLAILDLLQYNPKSVYLKGYTFFKGGYDKTYRKQNEDEVMSYMARAGNHDQYRQNLFVRKIILTEKVIDIDLSLANILESM